MAFKGVTAPAVHLSLPPAYLFKLPPAPLPQTLSPPISDHTLARPFNIPPELYSNLLSVKYPITIAVVYAITVYRLNQLNNSRRNRAWPISRTRAFYYFVIAHNVFLSVYSAWTFVGMTYALKNTIPNYRSGEGIVGVVDAMCKMQGPRGLSNAVTYNPLTSSWGITNQAINLAQGLPDNTDKGRLWNEGLAFYGWLFYLSKFYEVVDTLIILAKGKKSSLLQTYHHAGAMMCMWAGIRYMSPPIWMFALVNSAIHTLMYSYYTVSALGIRVPTKLKRSLTTLQIAQFVVGASYAFIHLFISYELPVQKPYIFAKNLSSALPSMTSSLAAAATANADGWFKKLILRASGQEGLAENVLNTYGETFGLDALKAAHVQKAGEEIRYKWETSTIRCVDTSGQAFAINLNVMYLLPLTYLFGSFFVKSYLNRSYKRRPSLPESLRKSSFDAAMGVNREVQEAMSGAQGSYSDAELAIEDQDTDLKSQISSANASMKKGAGKAGEEAQWLGNKAKEAAAKGVGKAKDAATKGSQKANATVANAKENVPPAANSHAKATADGAKTTANAGKENVKPIAKDSKGKTKGAAEAGKQELSEADMQAKKLIEEAYAAADRAARTSADGRAESIEVKDEAAYEVDMEEMMDEEEVRAMDKMQPGRT